MTTSISHHVCGGLNIESPAEPPKSKRVSGQNTPILPGAGFAFKRGCRTGEIEIQSSIYCIGIGTEVEHSA
jgi:hypothetical protein